MKFLIIEIIKFFSNYANKNATKKILLILPNAASAEIKEFVKAASTQINGFLKATGKFSKKTEKNFKCSSFQKTTLYGYYHFRRLFYDFISGFLNLFNKNLT
jgi:hypothetical protein